MYPHTLTGIFAAKSANTIRKNAVFLPAYTLLLGLIALLGYMAYAAHLSIKTPNDVVPALFATLFPEWFSGFAFAAIAIGALVPAAVMSIGAANLFTRNFWKAYVNPEVTPEGQAKVAKLASLVVKLGALVFILFVPTQFALYLQLLGGVWIMQTFPAVVCGLYFKGCAPRHCSRLGLGHADGNRPGVWRRYQAGAQLCAGRPQLRGLHRAVRVAAQLRGRSGRTGRAVHEASHSTPCTGLSHQAAAERPLERWAAIAASPTP